MWLTAVIFVVNLSEENLTKDEKKLVTNLMRVNHAGEVAAQGLYIGHALAAKSEEQREMMLEMASEEKAQLIWCNERIKDLGGRPSIFAPFSSAIVLASDLLIFLNPPVNLSLIHI